LDRFVIIPHAFSMRADAGFAQRATRDHDGSFLVAGNLEYFKGFDLILSGYGRYRDRGGSGVLKVAGTSGWDDPNPQVRSLLTSGIAHEVIGRHGRDSVRFLGRVNKQALAVERARAIATVVGSRFEAFTMVAGEAFLCGSPVILSDRTGWRMPAALCSGARLIDPYDPNDIAAAFAELEDPTVRDEYRAGADRMASYLQSDALGERTANFYREAITAGGKIRDL
jgi:glycosyltransferase involved in cell wall biosynthesis